MSLLEQKRSHTCNQLTESDLGEEVILMGWVQSLRDHGGRRFVDLRDRYGITQIVFKPETDEEIHKLAHQLRSEWCIGIQGIVEDRLKNGGSYNDRLKTGKIEIDVKKIEVFSKSEAPPFLIEDQIDTHEDKRLAHRAPPGVYFISVGVSSSKKSLSSKYFLTDCITLCRKKNLCCISERRKSSAR